MKSICLQCENEYESKRETSKFCSTNCRVKYNRKHGSKKSVGKFEMEVLYNSLLGLVEKMGNDKTSVQQEFNSRQMSNSLNELSNLGSAPKIKLRRSFENYVSLKRGCLCEEDWDSLKKEIEEDEHLPKNQRILLLTQNI